MVLNIPKEIKWYFIIRIVTPFMSHYFCIVGVGFPILDTSFHNTPAPPFMSPIKWPFIRCSWFQWFRRIWFWIWSISTRDRTHIHILIYHFYVTYKVNSISMEFYSRQSIYTCHLFSSLRVDCKQLLVYGSNRGTIWKLFTTITRVCTCWEMSSWFAHGCSWSSSVVMGEIHFHHGFANIVSTRNA